MNIDEPLAVDNTSVVYYYHADALGSIAKLTNSSGTIVQTYAYDTFGNIASGLPTSQPYTYTAREYDSETGLYFYRARYYDPKVGRFLTRDPIGFTGGVNLFAYVRNNPANLVDPFGLAECIWFGVSWDITPGWGWQMIHQKGACKNECGEWEPKTRNCACSCVGISGGASLDVATSDRSRNPKGWGIGIGPLSIGDGGAGWGGGLKYGVKYCWCDCDII